MGINAHRRVMSPFFSLILVLALFGAGIGIAAAADPVISITPTPKNVCVGDEFDVSVAVNPNGYDLEMAKVSLTYDPTLVTMEPATNGGMFTTVFVPGTDDGAGTVTGILGTGPGTSTPGDLAVLHMTATADGTFNLVITAAEVGLGSGTAPTPDVNPGVVNIAALTTYYQDADGDGYGNSAVSQVACAQPNGYVTDDTDCDDNDNTVYPGATELCDGKDNDCDSVVPANEADADGDGVRICGGDCDDTDGAVWQLLTGYTDADGDGYGTGAAQDVCSGASLLAGYATVGGDCDDANGAVNPGADEVCGNGIDDNCDGQIDEGCCPCDFCMPIEAGLNLVSVPRYVEVGGSSMASDIFNLSGIETCDCWDGCNGTWTRLPPTDMVVVPERAYFVYKVNAETLCLNGTSLVGTQALCKDTWAMVGFPSLNPMTVTEFRTASSLGDDFTTAWQWNDGGWYPTTGNMDPYRGYVLWMTEDGVMPSMIDG